MLNNVSLGRAGLALVAASSCMVCAMAAPSQKPNVPPTILQGVHRVVCLGDSITEAGEHPGGYVWLVRHYLSNLYPGQDIETLNAGVSGHRSNDMLARFQRDVLRKKPDLVTISVGVNDVWHGFMDNHPKGDGPRGIKLEDFKSNLESMVGQAQAAGIKVVILSTTVIFEDRNSPENKKVDKYNGVLRDIAREHYCPFVDFQRPFWTILDAYHSRTGGRDNFLTVDGVHMNAEGNKVMAHTILTGLGISPKGQEAVQAQVAADMTRR